MLALHGNTDLTYLGWFDVTLEDSLVSTFDRFDMRNFSVMVGCGSVWILAVRDDVVLVKKILTRE